MILSYDKFYRAHGLRMEAQIKSPPVTLFNTLELPKHSSIHFTQLDPDEGFEIPQSHFLLKEYHKKMWCTTTQYYQHEDTLGDFRLMKKNIEPEIRHYYRSNQKIKDPYDELVTDPMTVHIFSYGLINRRYNYFKTIKTNEMNKWCNHMRTVFTTLAAYAAQDNRNHFIILDTPKIIPSLSRLVQRENDDFDKALLRFFRSPDEWMILSLWKLFNKIDSFIFRDVPVETFKYINIIWQSGNNCNVINLEKLLSFNQLYNAGASKSERQFSKHVLFSFMNLNELTGTSQVVDGYAEDDNTLVVSEVDEDTPDEDMTALDLLLGDFGDDSGNAVVSSTNLANKLNAIDAEIDLADSVSGDDESEIDKKLSLLEFTDSEIAEDDSDFDSEELTYKTYEPINNNVLAVDTNTIEIATRQARMGNMTAGELRHATTLAVKYKTLKNPYKSSESLIHAATITPEDMTLDTNDSIVSEKAKALIPDESMYTSSLKQFDKKYINEVLPKHIVRSVMSLGKIGISIQDYDIEKVSNINDEYEIHTVKVATVNGKTSTVRFRIPSVNDFGEYRLGSIKYRLRKQWCDVPIRKISDSEVALTSYYSKLFIKRTPRAAFNYERWLGNKLIELGISADNTVINNIKLNNVFNPRVKLPREYTMIAKRISGFDAKGYHFIFDIDNAQTLIPDMVNTESKVQIGYGIDNPKDKVLMDKTTGVISVDGSDVNLVDYLEVAVDKVPPHDYSELSLFGKPIPLVYILAYQIGLGTLLKTLDCKYERLTSVPAEMQRTHLIIRFKDEVLAIPNTDKKSCMLLAGLNRYHNDIKKMSVYAFDDKEVYSTVFENNGVDLRYLKECNTLFPLWVDHITYDILEQMGEPTDLVQLLIRASGMLLDDQHPDAMDSNYMRIRGYERFSGMIYSELAREARSFNFKPNRKDKQFSINPDAVWYAIRNDNSIAQVQECNPIHSLKEQEALVFTGEGGRSSITMTAETRKFNESDIGIVSEATVDSQLVGVITFLTSNPRISNLYGRLTPVDINKEIPASSLVSTSMLLSPCADIENPVRTITISIQNSQTMAADGYQLLPVRTGYERVIGSRTADIFCRTADMDGEITDRDDKNGTLTVTYKDGSISRISTAVEYAPWAGKLISQVTKCDFQKGDKVSAGDVLTYNPTFFKKDKLLPNQVSMTTQCLARVAIIEGGDVYEDSGAFSSEMAARMGTTLAHVRNITLDNTQDIADLVEVGDEVEPDSILCTIVNAQTDSSFYDEQTLKLLQKIGSTSPKAKDKGVVTKIEVLYTGEVEDMPPNVQDAASASDLNLFRRARKLGTEIKDGRVDIGHRIDGVGLGLNQVVIRVYILSPLSMATGDKFVISNQLKGTVARVWTDNNRDESGETIDAYFSGTSIDNRIVDSPYLIGTTSTLMLKITEKVVDHYFN